MIRPIHDRQIRNEYERDACVSPVAKYLNVTHSFCSADIGFGTRLDGCIVMSVDIWSRMK